jgi:GntR family transcriptional regulator, rspAB operon transcriptional repressor
MPRARPLLPDLHSQAKPHSKAEPSPSGLPLPRGAFTRSAYEAIRNAIVDCTLLPGVALSEQALCESLGVSRAPVRDALRQLAAESLVQVIAQRGTYVALIDPAKVRDAVFVRQAIECQAAQLACSAAQGDKAHLLTLLENQENASERADYAAHLQADEALHQHILNLAGHPHAWPALRLARTGMNRVRHLAISAAGSHHIAIEQHRHIVQAIVQGHAQQAVDLMRQHIRAPLSFLDAIATQYPQCIQTNDPISGS